MYKINCHLFLKKCYKYSIPLNKNYEKQSNISSRLNKSIILNHNLTGEMAEWFKAHAWKVCVPSLVPWVRIPLSPP